MMADRSWQAGGKPWWLSIPGMNWRHRKHWPPVPVANLLCAIACTMHLVRMQAPGKDLIRNQLKYAGNFITFLRAAGNSRDDAYLRRVALCEVTDVTPAKTEVASIIQWAEILCPEKELPGRKEGQS